MPRPRSILWVDDEVESLTPHVMFLEEQGFSVDTSAHGDDALVMLQRQPYGVVLLDEQMPGRRGLELFRAIRSVDQSMPVVMVTKSEEPETFKDALGADVSDYLVKPVNPRQILTVVTRLLEGDRIRQQRLSRDFASRFRELEARRGRLMDRLKDGFIALDMEPFKDTVDAMDRAWVYDLRYFTNHIDNEAVLVLSPADRKAWFFARDVKRAAAASGIRETHPRAAFPAMARQIFAKAAKVYTKLKADAKKAVDASLPQGVRTERGLDGEITI